MNQLPTIPVHAVMLDEQTLGQLVFDVGHAAELIGLVCKAAGARRGQEVALTADALGRAHHAFTARELVAIQVRYRFGGEEWWDTVTRIDRGIQLIRISHTRARSATALTDGR
jgi:hypothetical protein